MLLVQMKEVYEEYGRYMGNKEKKITLQKILKINPKMSKSGKERKDVKII